MAKIKFSIQLVEWLIYCYATFSPKSAIIGARSDKIVTKVVTIIPGQNWWYTGNEGDYT